MSSSLKKRNSKIHDMSDSGSESDSLLKPKNKGHKNGHTKKSFSPSPQKSARIQFVDNFLNMSDSNSDDDDDRKRAKPVKHKKVTSESKPTPSALQKPHKQNYSKPFKQEKSSMEDKHLASSKHRQEKSSMENKHVSSSKHRQEHSTREDKHLTSSKPRKEKQSMDDKSVISSKHSQGKTLSEDKSMISSKHRQEKSSMEDKHVSSIVNKHTIKTDGQNSSSPVSLKRKHSSSPVVPKELRKAVTEILMANENSSAKKKSLPPCKYGPECYRKNPSHFEEYSHEKGANIEKRKKRSTSPPAKKLKTSSSTPEPGCSKEASTSQRKSVSKLSAVSVGGARSMGVAKSVMDRIEQAQPYSFFLTKVSGIADKYNSFMAMDIKDILSPEMGNLTSSCQFNFMFDIAWLMKQYPAQFRSKPLLVVHGEQGPSKNALQAEAMAYSNIKFCQAKLEMMYGTHHTKMMLLLYDTGLRVVIHTSNLIANDWHQKTQGMWISPVFPQLPSPGRDKGESATHFKRDLLAYMAAYKAYQLKEWQEHIERHDMSAAKVVIIGSVPGRHVGDQAKHLWGHLKLRRCLQQHGPTPGTVKAWPVVGQFSSIGSMGPNKDSWVCGEFLQSLSATKGGVSGMQSNARMQLVFPSKDNVRLSLEGFPAGGSIPYSIHTAKKQTFLHDLFHVWKSEGRGRTGAMPHIKTYIRPKQDGTQAAWFLVTSSNLSKAAWGALEKKGLQLMIRSYEIGVLMLPKFFDDSEVFDVTTDVDLARSTQTLALPYDLPVQAYDKKDRPWMWDIPYMDLPDTNGNVWCPFSKR